MKRCENCQSTDSVREYKWEDKSWGTRYKMLCPKCADKLKSDGIDFLGVSELQNTDSSLTVQEAGTSKGLAVISYTVLIIGLIAGVVAGNSFPVVNMDKFEITKSFNVALALETWLGSGILFAILYGISCILRNQEIIIEKLSKNDKS